MQLAGLDVGSSDNRASSGVATLKAGKLSVKHCKALHASELLNAVDRLDVLAVDGPCVPAELKEETSRLAEHLFARGIFARRCKSGFSHVRGTGRAFRIATTAAVNRTCSNAGVIVEAFPNAFLALCLPDEFHANRPKMGRGEKFDWLFETWRNVGLADRLLAVVQVDDPFGGGFVLPPRDLWQDWARRGLDDEARRLSEIRIAGG